MLKPEHSNKGSVLRSVGALGAVLSVVGGLVILFVMPGTYPAVSGMLLLTMGFTFLTGLLLYLLGKVFLR